MEKEKVSPDSSTHISSKRKKLKKRKEKDDYREHKKGKKLKISRHSSSECDSSSKRNSKKKKEKRKSSKSKTPIDDDGCIDLGIKPLSSYVDDREELHRQLFTIISKKELKRMLPSLLKKLDLKEIKKLCYEQLEILSQKRLRHILAGEEMASSSSSSSDGDDDNDDGEPNDESDPCSKLQVAHQKGINRESEQQVESRRSGAEDADLSIFQEMIVAPNQAEIDELVEGNVKTNATSEGIVNEGEQQTSGEEARGEEDDDADEEAELRMLEFRARALKSLVLARERQMKQKMGQPK